MGDHLLFLGLAHFHRGVPEDRESHRVLGGGRVVFLDGGEFVDAFQ
jgi:hypothetical protein